MDWLQHTQAMLKLWLNTQQQIMDGWEALAPMRYSTLLEAVQHTINSMASSNTDPIAQVTAEKLFSSQIGIIRLLDISTRIWQNLLPAFENGGDWESILRQQMENLRQELLTSATQDIHVSGSVQQQWGYFLQEALLLQRSSIEMLQKNTAWDGNTATLIDMTSLYQDTLGVLLQGYTRDINEKLHRCFAAWLDMQQALQDYSTLLINTWVYAFERLTRELAQLAKQGETVESVRHFLNRWSATADEVFKEAFRSQHFVEAQGKLVNVVMTYRQGQRQVNEILLHAYDLPTRSEMDEAHRRIYELHKEVKALRRELAALKAEQPKQKTRKQQKA